MKNNLKKLCMLGLPLIALICLSSCKKEKEEGDVVLTLVGDASVTVSLNSTYTDQGAKATDDKEGDLTSKIVVTGLSSVNTDSTGTYVITYTVTDKKKNTRTKTRTVRVKNDAETLVGTYSVVDTNPYPSSQTTDYNDTITVSRSTNNKIWVSTFANRAGGKVFMNVTSDTTITLSGPPYQVVTCGTPSVPHTFRDSGGAQYVNSISKTSPVKITIFYTETAGTNSQAKAVYTKFD